MSVSASTNATASIRELRTDFRSVKRKLEQHGRITITDNGEPAFVMTPIPRRRPKTTPMPDYYQQLLEHQPIPMSEEATRAFHEENRDDC